MGSVRDISSLERKQGAPWVDTRYAGDMSADKQSGPVLVHDARGVRFIAPEWPAPARVRARMSTREGGCSMSPWDSLNLGDHVGDDPEHVLRNREYWQQSLGRRPVYLTQVHGTHCVRLSDETPDGLQADVCECLDETAAATIMVADCMPVLMCDVQGTWVAAGHAGWRGLAGDAGVGVLEVMVCQAAQRGVPAGDLLVWLGPCIGPTAFEVGNDVREAFMSPDPQIQRCFAPTGMDSKWWANLQALARLRLQRLGVCGVYGNDGSEAWCTFSQSELFFSHRRDSRLLGASGRLAASVWLN